MGHAGRIFSQALNPIGPFTGGGGTTSPLGPAVPFANLVSGGGQRTPRPSAGAGTTSGGANVAPGAAASAVSGPSVSAPSQAPVSPLLAGTPTSPGGTPQLSPGLVGATNPTPEDILRMAATGGGMGVGLPQGV